MKWLFRTASALLWAIERASIRGQCWLEDHYPGKRSLDEIEEYLTEIQEHPRVGMPPRGRK